MKFYQKGLALMLTTALVLVGAVACQKGSDAEGESADVTGSEGAIVEETGSNQKAGNESSNYLDLLNKATTIDNYYTKYTLYQNMGTNEIEVWRKGNKIKFRRVAEKTTSEEYVDLDTAERYLFNLTDKTGMKTELMGVEKQLIDRVLWLFDMETLFNNPESIRLVASKKEKFNGVPCVYLEFKTFEDEVLKFHINKENGVVMNFEHFYKGKEKVAYSTRHVFETGAVSDEVFTLPAGIEIKEY